MTGLIISVTSLTPITPAQFHEISDRTLLVLPNDDKAFSKEAQQDLREMLPDATLVRINGGHTATLYRVEEYVKATREFLANLWKCECEGGILNSSENLVFVIKGNCD